MIDELWGGRLSFIYFPLQPNHCIRATFSLLLQYVFLTTNVSLWIGILGRFSFSSTFFYKSSWHLTGTAVVDGNMRSSLSDLNQRPSSLKIWSKHNREPHCVDWKLKRKEMMVMIREAQWPCWSRTTKQRGGAQLQTWVSVNPPLHWTGSAVWPSGTLNANPLPPSRGS